MHSTKERRHGLHAVFLCVSVTVSFQLFYHQISLQTTTKKCLANVLVISPNQTRMFMLQTHVERVECVTPAGPGLSNLLWLCLIWRSHAVSVAKAYRRSHFVYICVFTHHVCVMLYGHLKTKPVSGGSPILQKHRSSVFSRFMQWMPRKSNVFCSSSVF